MKDTHVLKLFTDGGARGNPGHSACGVAIYDLNGNLIKINGKYCGVLTNNQAEYEALLTGLRMAHAMKANEIECYLDSDLIVKQIKGEFKIKNKIINEYVRKINTLLKNFHKVNFIHVARSENSIADKIVNIILDTVELFK